MSARHDRREWYRRFPECRVVLETAAGCTRRPVDVVEGHVVDVPAALPGEGAIAAAARY